MTPQELYQALDKADLDYEVVEVFEGARWVRFLIDEDEAYKVFAETLDNEDIVEGRGFEVDEIVEVVDDE